jgi:ubiquinone/menaquinone biosynthesis C-methylase UbiE
MFHNFVNRHDFNSLVKKGSKSLPTLLNKLLSSNKKKVETTWSKVSYQKDNWWDIPEVLERWNQLITGDNKLDYYEYTCEKYLKTSKELKGFSVGCGTGHRELKWASTGLFSQIDAIDISQERINYSIEEAKKNGFINIINYWVANIYELELTHNLYDVVFIEQTLHHFSPLKKVLTKLKYCLKPKGYLIINEFVGPTRFQWTERQLEIINSTLDLLPLKYRKKINNTDLKTNIFRPSKLSMILGDPSEAIESSNILKSLDEEFDLVELKEYGGTIILLLFYQIAQNFISDNELTKRWIKLCFEIEDLLLAENEIKSDYIFAVYKKKDEKIIK